MQKLAQRSYEAGDIYEGTYEGWYCVSCEAFRQEKDLVDGKCPFHPTLTPEWIKEKNYFFRLSKYRDRLLAHFEAHPGFLQPDVRRNEILRLLEAGLEDISMSRAGQAWGIPLPFAPENVVYVWFDALINYASAVGYGTDDARFAQWWPADLHIIGKDITRFHTVVWPAMLWSAGIEAPRQVFGHGWINYGGQRMSKTLGTSVDPGGSGGEVRARSGAALPHQGDRLRQRRRLHLGALRGALQRRPGQQPRQPGQPRHAMVHKYRGGTVDAGRRAAARWPRWSPTRPRGITQAMGRLALHEGVAAAFDIVTAANGFVAERRRGRWPRIRRRPGGWTPCCSRSVEAVRAAATLLLPVMPTSAGRAAAPAGRHRRRPAEVRLRSRRRLAERRRAHAAGRPGDVAANRSGRVRPRRRM